MKNKTLAAVFATLFVLIFFPFLIYQHYQVKLYIIHSKKYKFLEESCTAKKAKLTSLISGLNGVAASPSDADSADMIFSELRHISYAANHPEVQTWMHAEDSKQRTSVARKWAIKAIEEMHENSIFYGNLSDEYKKAASNPWKYRLLGPVSSKRRELQLEWDPGVSDERSQQVPAPPQD